MIVKVEMRVGRKEGIGGDWRENIDNEIMESGMRSM